ncbi:branched-chain amino acid ABC transporter permease [Rhodovulum marinum]|uniref:Amino acid/amide ABC transporter membrane protein 2 (HAAT family) n=1 Tax=Rhodovulum marinum TaxID=320662 RepID=A0A4V2SR66_9RHOB|nr:branched-chain amino acid ABC transporter permease [Rhodovulum marinum]TCP41886.1 amino acid/amide ABC transporter membrane protein 2 (HAAT family) [Rhodovulum marinum]
MSARVFALHGGLIAVLLALHFLLPVYHHGNFARVMVLACYAIGYNVLFGYTGLLSLGHAMFFAAGMYGMGLPLHYLGIGAELAFLAGLASAALLALVVGLLALRTVGVAFMIVTLMFSEAVYLTILLAGRWTRGDEGLVLARPERVFLGLDLSNPDIRYLVALGLFALCLVGTLWLVRQPSGRVLIAIRENEERAQLLGYDIFRHKLAAVVISGTISGAAGAAYGLMFGYVGASFAEVQYSIFPLLWVLLGGAGTIIGPFFGVLFMFYLIDLSSGLTSAYMLIAGVALVLLTLFAPQGLAGELRRRWVRWLP